MSMAIAYGKKGSTHLSTNGSNGLCGSAVHEVSTQKILYIPGQISCKICRLVYIDRHVKTQQCT